MKRWFTVVLALVALNGCAYSKPACEAINLADQACEYFLVEYQDEAGNVHREKVPKSELKAAAERARIQRMNLEVKEACR